MGTNTEKLNDTETVEKTAVPRKYQVLFHNDDYTPMEFVMEVLMVIFNKTAQEAILITETVHIKGKAVVAIYPKNIAQMKIKQVTEVSLANEYPLKCTMEAI